MTRKEPTKDDVIQYLVDCMAYSRDEAESMASGDDWCDYFSPEMMQEMRELVGLDPVNPARRV